jgi:hypothetical protein
MGETTDTNAPAAAQPPAEALAADPGPVCPNCNAPLQGAYCFACGQPRKGTIRPLAGIVADFLDTVFNIDSRTWRTLGPLYFSPGRLSNDYIAGRRVRYVTPLRLYFFLSIVAFLVISMISNFEEAKVQVREPDRPLTEAEAKRRVDEVEKAIAFVPESARAEVRAELERELAKEREAAAAQAAAAPERVRAERIAGAVVEAEREPKKKMFSFNGKPWDREENPLVVSWWPDSLNDALNAEVEALIGKLEALEKDPKPFFEELFSIAPQALFFILPLFAVLLKLAYLFKRRLYMEHMIVALHSHSFLCLSLLVIVGLVQLSGAVEEIGVLRALVAVAVAAAGGWIPIYLLLMQRRVYRQNWFLTILKYGVLGICYVVLLSFGLVAAMLASLVFL